MLDEPRKSWCCSHIHILWDARSVQMEVSINEGIPKSSILIGFSRINHLAIGVSPIYGKPQIFYKLRHENAQSPANASIADPKGVKSLEGNNVAMGPKLKTQKKNLSPGAGMKWYETILFFASPRYIDPLLHRRIGA